MLKLGDGMVEACEKLPNLCAFLNGLELREIPDYERIRVFLFGDAALRSLRTNADNSVYVVDGLGKRIVDVLGADPDVRTTGHFSAERLQFAWTMFRALRFNALSDIYPFLKPEVLELVRLAYQELTEHTARISNFTQKS